jgi:hypothetical protein
VIDLSFDRQILHFDLLIQTASPYVPQRDDFLVSRWAESEYFKGADIGRGYPGIYEPKVCRLWVGENRPFIYSGAIYARRSYGFEIRQWLVLVLLMLAWLVVIMRFIRKRRSYKRWRSGECEACGYDLRASPLRCPECGGVGQGAAANKRRKREV